MCQRHKIDAEAYRVCSADSLLADSVGNAQDPPEVCRIGFIRATNIIMIIIIIVTRTVHRGRAFTEIRDARRWAS